ncbi:hypothetical protein PGB90_010595 [Kerria lacca]
METPFVAASKKIQNTFVSEKVLTSVFLNRHGVILVEYLSYGNTVNADRYC